VTGRNPGQEDQVRTTSNPAFRNLPRNGYAGFNGAYAGVDPYGQAGVAQRPMTVDDVVIRTAMTLGLAVITGGLTIAFQAWALVLPAFLIGLVVSLIVIFTRKPNAALVLIYAAAEGVALGGITGLFDRVYPGIAFQAIVGTFGVFAAMLVVYKTGVVRVTPRMTRWVIGATVGAVFVMLADLIVHLFGGNLGIRDGSPLSIVFSLLVIGIAAFNLMLDFEQATQMIRGGYPAKWAWYAAFGLMVTLVWLYLEILRLLSYLQRN
jgi:uncharacterized YccA/Bax inhibitor family protein